MRRSFLFSEFEFKGGGALNVHPGDDRNTSTFIHRDLAVRSCLIDSNMVVKIGDFGLTRRIEKGKYYTQSTQSKDSLPYCIMAPESLNERCRKYSTKSDVWS